MSVHLQREIEGLKRSVLSLCALVEEQAQIAVRAMLDRDEEAARQVEFRDTEIDQREVDIEEDCLKILALYQPVAADLRFIVCAMKMNNDLERIGDLAVNIARKAITFSSLPPMEIPFDLCGMWHKVQEMLRDALDAMVHQDAVLANEVCARDDEVDELKHEMRLRAEEAIRMDPEQTSALLTFLAVSRSLERMADHATNIAEDVIYMVRGNIVRHGAFHDDSENRLRPKQR